MSQDHECKCDGNHSCKKQEQSCHCEEERGLIISFKETMSGSYTLVKKENLVISPEGNISYIIPKGAEPKQKKFEFTVTATAPVRKFLNPMSDSFLLTNLEGKVTMEDVCTDKDIDDGALSLNGIKTGKLDYTLIFHQDNITYCYLGFKTPTLSNPIESMTTLEGHIIVIEPGKPKKAHPSTCYFDPNDLKEFLWSFFQNLKVK